MNDKYIAAIVDWLDQQKAAEGLPYFTCTDEPFLQMSAEWQAGELKLWLEYAESIDGDLVPDPRFIFHLDEGLKPTKVWYENGLVGVSMWCDEQDSYPLQFAKLVYERHMLPRIKEVTA